MNHTPHTPLRTVATVAIVGRGRLGRAIARALEAAGLRVFGPLGRGEVVPLADIVLLCVPDAEIAGAAAALADRADHPGLVGHVSGATPITGVDFGLHPLQTFTGDEGPEAFHGIGCAIAGRTPEALDVAAHLAELLGTRPFPLADEDRASYHAAASVASNFVVTLLAAAEQLAATAGLTGADARALLAPLVRTTVENWAARGAGSALTGPVARGDVQTVGRQRDAVTTNAPDLLPLFDELVTSTRALSEKGRTAA
ncbi:DUF2520 domain-containing protein [Microbacterium sp. 2FI]|uniref:DUF2520 domain-containing protein n=1 Tax=Microbacterium sp. 2FI TaxID=2502193 RepID=UPI0010F9EEB1|nr:DUF2520 domain-containing protein [Microbacterium sp. 2FI]